MRKDKKTIVVLGSGRCYHTMDWFRSAQKLQPHNPPLLITDLVEGESFHKLIHSQDQVEYLFILDKYLLQKQCRVGNIWRNFLKLLVLPIQVIRLRKLLKKYSVSLIHAHSTYYIALARFSGYPYVATPQGSEVLVRPRRSRFFKFFLKMALSRTARITVDSEAMQTVLLNLYGQKACLIQNGIDVNFIEAALKEATSEPHLLVSMRAFTPNYRIDLLIKARNETLPSYPIYFCYPFVDEQYKHRSMQKSLNIDRDLGRLDRRELYALFSKAVLVVSIPTSDSSPRSVYEAIFCGAFVATPRAAWVDTLPSCMLSRLILVDLSSRSWLVDAMKYATNNQSRKFFPSDDALNMFDQERSMLRFYQEVYSQIGIDDEK